jgi:endoglucanase
VNAIRATGGNNTLRYIMVPTHAANPSTTTIEDMVIPNDDPRIIVSLHTYFPYGFSLDTEAAWGSASDRSEMEQDLDRIYDLLPARGRAVVIGEWGSINKNNTDVRVDHAETYARMVRERGMCPIWWDNGASAPGADGFALLDRDEQPPDWVFPEIATALVAGAASGAGF